MKSRILKGIIVLTIILFNSACDREMVYDQFQRIDNNSWKWNDQKEFNVNLADTSSFYNILIQLRHSTDYPLSNLYMFVNVVGPSGQTMTDTINFLLAENSGKWMGKGIGNIRALSFLYKKNTLFPEIGEYNFRIEQAMRLPEVPVSEIGLRIEKVNQK